LTSSRPSCVRSSYAGGALGTPKNRERRDVDLISDVVELLAVWREERECPVENLIFSGENGSGCLSPTILLRRHLYPAMAGAEIQRLGPLRRSDVP
jgi:hypothetical protein